MARPANAAVEDDGYIPFATRFRAWWEGVDATELMRSSNSSAVPGQSLVIEDNRAAMTGLDPERLRLWEDLWGKGFVLPGGAGVTESLLEPLKLETGGKLLDLSAGLGGVPRAMKRRFGCCVTGLEYWQPVAEAGQDMSVEAGVAAKVPISHYDPMAFEASSEKYDCAYAREFFYLVRDKESLLHKVVRSIREEGHFVFTDYALTDYDQADPDIAAWANAEPVQPQTWTLKRYKQVLDELDVSIQVFADITDTLLDLTKTTWSRFTADLASKKITKGYADWLLSDGEVWLKRTHAMQSGKLRVLRVHAVRKGIHLLSDW